MRLTPEQVSAIKQSATDVFGSTTVVRLFGSRLDDSQRGGDIDLHISRRGGRPDYESEGRFYSRVARRIGERSIDLVFYDPAQPLRPIDRVALSTGVEL